MEKSIADEGVLVGVSGLLELTVARTNVSLLTSYW
jgi:hypothetical protein